MKSTSKGIVALLIIMIVGGGAYYMLTTTDDTNAESDIDLESLNVDHFYTYEELLEMPFFLSGAKIGETLMIVFPDHVTIEYTYGAIYGETHSGMVVYDLILHTSSAHNVVYYQFPIPSDSTFGGILLGSIDYYDVIADKTGSISLFFKFGSGYYIDALDLDVESSHIVYENTGVGISVYNSADGTYWSLEDIPEWMNEISDQWYQGIIDSGDYTILAISPDESVTKTIHVVTEPFVLWDPFGDLVNSGDPIDPDNNNNTDDNTTNNNIIDDLKQIVNIAGYDIPILFVIIGFVLMLIFGVALMRK